MRLIRELKQAGEHRDSKTVTHAGTSQFF